MAGTGSLAWAVYDLLSRPSELAAALLLSAIAGVAARFSIRIDRSAIHVSLGEAMHYLALFALGPAAAVLSVVVETGVGVAATSRRWSGRLFSPLSASLVMGAVGWSSWALSGAVGWKQVDVGALLALAIGISLACAVLDAVLTGALLALKRRQHVERITPTWLAARFGASVGPACGAAVTFIGYRDFGMPFLLAVVAVLAMVGVTVAYASRQLASRQRSCDESLEEAHKWRQAAQTDALTHVPNRGFFNERLPVEIKQARATGTPLAMALLDIDHFHDINMTYGWTTGDAVLQYFAQVAKAHLRSTDWLARYGGEEFVVVLPGTDLDDARAVAERLRAAVEGTQFLAVDGRVVPVTLSIGATVLTDDLDDAIGLSTKVGRACAEAKTTGRNRVVVLQ